MTLEPFVIEGFGGLNLADDPQEMGASGATGVADIDYDRRGRIRTRNGYTIVKSLTSTSLDGFATFESTAGLKQFVVGYRNGATKKYEAYGAAGGAAVASATPTNTRANTARIGTLAGEYLYIGNGADTIWRWDGAAFTQPAGMPTALYLAVDANSNRLVAAFTSHGSQVEWSDPGAPETFSGNSILLTPGDGMNLEGLVSWQNYVFAFKRRRFFVFTGERPDDDGLPVFDYDTVDGYGCVIPPVAGDEGVYFFDGRTIWLTTGGVPARVSTPIEASLRGEVALAGITDSTVDPALLTSAILSYSLGRLYLSVVINSGGRVVFVYDPKIDKWTIYVRGLQFFASLRRASQDKEYTFTLGNTIPSTPGVYYHDPTRYDDFWDGGVGGAATISWYYVTGFYAVGPPERVAVIGETCLIGGILDAGGIPAINVLITTDLGSATGTTGTTLFGATNGLGDREAWMMADAEGRRWQLQLQGTGGFVVSRVTHLVTFVKPAGIE